MCDSRPGGRDLPDVLRAAAAGGVDIVQLRDKALGDDELVAVAHAAHALCERLGMLLIVNDRPRVAAAAGADGVHVGQDDAPVAQAREQAGPSLLVGLSTHTAWQIEAARDVDYIGVGPVFRTPTKPAAEAVGLELVRHAAGHAHAPFFAIGGIDADNLVQVIGAGARRIAVVRAIAAASDPEAAARRLAAQLDSAAAAGGGSGGRR